MISFKTDIFDTKKRILNDFQDLHKTQKMILSCEVFVLNVFQTATIFGQNLLNKIH